MTPSGVSVRNDSRPVALITSANARNINARRERDGFSGIRYLGVQKILEAGFDAIGDFVQQRGACGNRQAAPVSMQSFTCRGDGFVYLAATSFGNLGDYGGIGGIHVGELARATHK